MAAEVGLSPVVEVSLLVETSSLVADSALPLPDSGMSSFLPALAKALQMVSLPGPPALVHASIHALFALVSGELVL